MSTTCQSCSMTIESGPYCEHCADGNGALLPFEEVAARFDQWTARRHPDLEPGELRRMTLSFMKKMPAWSGHPGVQEA